MIARASVTLCLFAAAGLLACDRVVDIGQKARLPPSGLPTNDAAPVGTDAALDSDDGGATTSPPDSGAPEAPPADTGPPDAPASAPLWSSSLESGDVSDWEMGGPIVGGTFTRVVTTSISEEQAHTGTRAIKITFDSADGADHMGEYYRRIHTTPAYYGAWFWIDQPHTVDTYWTLLYFFYQREPGNPGSRRGLWDVNLDDQSIYFFDENARRQVNPQPRRPYPTNQWFHIEAYFSYEGSNGQQWVQDGVWCQPRHITKSDRVYRIT